MLFYFIFCINLLKNRLVSLFISLAFFKIHETIVETIKNLNCLFIFYQILFYVNDNYTTIYMIGFLEFLKFKLVWLFLFRIFYPLDDFLKLFVSLFVSYKLILFLNTKCSAFLIISFLIILKLKFCYLYYLTSVELHFSVWLRNRSFLYLLLSLLWVTFGTLMSVALVVEPIDRAITPYSFSAYQLYTYFFVYIYNLLIKDTNKESLLKNIENLVDNPWSSIFVLIMFGYIDYYCRATNLVNNLLLPRVDWIWWKPYDCWWELWSLGELWLLVGALTDRCSPFDLRDWDTSTFAGIDPTDGLGMALMFYINRNKIIQVEPDSTENDFEIWITDKTRQFFDSIFNSRSLRINDFDSTKLWNFILKILITNIYMIDLCEKKYYKNNYFAIVFDNTSIELLSLLNFICSRYSFIKILQVNDINLNNDLESNFQINKSLTKKSLKLSDTCLIISTNPRYEGYYVNLNLRQLFYKKVFNCFLIGSYLDLTFPISFLGSNIKTVTNFFKGNNLYCRDTKKSESPFLITSIEFFKRSDNKTILEIFKLLKYENLLNNIWKGFNVLSSTLSRTGVLSFNNFSALSIKDLNNLSSLYFSTISSENSSNLKKIVEIKLLNYNNIILDKYYLDSSDKSFIDQNICFNNNYNFFEKALKTDKLKCYYLPTSTFFESNESFINSLGFIKKTNRLIFNEKLRNSWQVMRQFLNSLKENLNLLLDKNNKIILFNSNKLSCFKNFLYFHYHATQMLTNLNFFLATRNKPFFSKNTKFKSTSRKNFSSKLTYWLDDFFIGGKDDFSQHSLILTDCSKTFRIESSNFD